MRTKNLISEAFRQYAKDMDKIYFQLNAVKESYTSKDAQRINEGFWDTVKAAAKGTGAFLGKTTQKISNFSSDVYDKGVELGKKAVEVGKDLANKVVEVSKNAVEAIKKAPGRLFDACKDLYSSVSNEVGEIYKKAKEKGGEWMASAKQTVTDLYNKVSLSLANGVRSFKDWATKNVEEMKKTVETKKGELIEASKFAKTSLNDTIKKVGEAIESALTKGKDIAKNVALFSMGLVILPFYASVQMAKKTYQLGEEIAESVKAGIETLKTNCADVWKEVQAGFAEGKAAVAEGYIIKTFERFNYGK